MGASLRAVRRSGPALPARPCQSLSARCPRRTSSPVSCCAGQTPAPSPAPDPLVPGLDRQVGGSPGLPGRTGEGAKGKLQNEDLGGPGPGGWVGALAPAAVPRLISVDQECGAAVNTHVYSAGMGPLAAQTRPPPSWCWC